jgi:hypothetical protein
MKYAHLHYLYGTVLKIDIDHKKLSWFTFKGIQLLSRYFHLRYLLIKKSPSKKGWHIIIGLKEKMTDSEIIAWQFAIDSDRKRERYNLLRHTFGNSMKDWNILFSNKINKPLPKAL